MPQELGFLQAIGLDALMVSALGLVQVGGGVLIAIPRSRVAGGIAAHVALLVSAVALLVGANYAMGIVSILLAILAGYLAYDAYYGT
jgi:hypothetical protein